MNTAFDILGIKEQEFDKILSSKDAFIGISKCLFMCLKSGNIKLVDIAVELLEHISSVIHFRDDEVHEDEEVWRTIKGTHVLIDDGNITKGPEALRNLSKVKEFQISDEMKPERTDYDVSENDGFQEFMHKNVKKLMPIFKNGGKEALESEWRKYRLQRCSVGLHEINITEAENEFDNFTRSIADGWILQYNSELKDKFIHEITKSPEMHNAALNVMYDRYKEICERDGEKALSFDEFLITPIKMYRGGTGEEYSKASPFSSYTFDKSVAEKFKNSELGLGNDEDNGVVWEAEIRPIDTFGSYPAFSGEMEIFVPLEIAPNKNRDEADVNLDGDIDDVDWITVKGNHIPIDPETKDPIGGQMRALGRNPSGESHKKDKVLSDTAKRMLEEANNARYAPFGESYEEKKE